MSESLAVKMSGWKSLGTVRPIVLHGTLEDDGWRELPDARAGYGKISADDGSNFCIFSFTSAGVVTLEMNSGNFIDSDTDGYYCIYQSSAQVIIKNRIGSEKEIHLTIYPY